MNSALPRRRGTARAAAAAALVAALLAGCQSAPTRDPDYAWVPPSNAPPPPATDGAIYRSGQGLALFEDVRARQVGDILTIVLEEETDAEKAANTSLDKSTSASLPNPTVLGTTPLFGVPGALPLAATDGNTLEFNAESSTQFAGDAASSQSNKLSGTIAVSVVRVLPNGDLVVRGEKLLALNQGSEHIRLSGVVRKADIRADNSVSSRKIANASVTYAGEGAPADVNTIALLGRLLMSAFFLF